MPGFHLFRYVISHQFPIFIIEVELSWMEAEHLGVQIIMNSVGNHKNDVILTTVTMVEIQINHNRKIM